MNTNLVYLKTPQCDREDHVLHFPIRDTNNGKIFLTISENIKLRDFQKELRLWKQSKKFAKNIWYFDVTDKPILIERQSDLNNMLELIERWGTTFLFTEEPRGRHVLVAEISVELCSYKSEMQKEHKKKYNDDSSTFFNKTNLKSNSSKRSLEDVKFESEERSEEPSEEPSNQKILWNKKQTESKEMKVLNQLDDSSTMPPLWFKEWMETMKNDMVHKITDEVTKKVTKKLIKYFDLFLQYKFNERIQPQNTSSPLERDPQCSSEPMEKKDQKRSQEEKQLSDISIDTSIERKEEPQNADIAKEQVTKNERSIVNSKKIIKKMPNEISVNPVISIIKLSKKHEKSGNSIKKNHRETPSQIAEQLSDQISAELQNAITARELQLDFCEVKVIGDEIRKLILDFYLKKPHKQDAQTATDNLENDAKLQEKSDENSFTADPKFRSTKSADWKPGKLENGFHMSCSVTGHQMLDENQQNKDIWFGRYDADDIDKTSFCSCNQEEDDDDAFEIIQMPTERNSFTLEEPVTEQERHDSNSDSPSFELLTETESSSPCSIYITEDHFAAKEEKSTEEDPHSNSNNNNSTNCDGYQPEFDKTNIKSMDTDLEKRPSGAYSFMKETVLAQDSNSFCKSLRAKQRSNEDKYSRDDGKLLPEDTCGLYDEVKNSHTSYLTVQTHCDWQSQCTNLGDLTQSFHSHTTSINDITDVSHSSQMPSTDSQDATAIPRSSLDPQVGNDQVKNIRMDERHDADNYPKCQASTPQDIFTDTVHQSHRANGFSNRSSPKAGSEKAFAAEQPLGSNESVHILPETLVIAAAQVGSFAYEVFDKIRTHAKEDSKRRSGTKSDHKKHFGNLSFL